MILSASVCNAKPWVCDNTSMVDTKLDSSAFETIRFATPADTTGVNISTGDANAVFAKVSGTELVFSSNFPIFNTDSGASRVFNTNMFMTFENCSNFNQNILIPNGVTDMYHTFCNCRALNQNIRIPNSVTNIQSLFANCLALNQNIQLPSSVNYSALGVFYNCQSLNQNIRIPNSIKSMRGFFNNCRSLNQNILIPDGAITIDHMFSECDVFNQNILIPNSVTGMNNTFQWCANLDQNILIPNGVERLEGAFSQCARLNQNILIPPSVKCIRGIFAFSFNMNQDIYIYSQNIEPGRDTPMANAFISTNIGKVHIPTSVPKDTSNYMYNCLVNGNTGIRFSPGKIFNDLPVDIDHWPPENV